MIKMNGASSPVMEANHRLVEMSSDRRQSILGDVLLVEYQSHVMDTAFVYRKCFFG